METTGPVSRSGDIDHAAPGKRRRTRARFILSNPPATSIASPELSAGRAFSEAPTEVPLRFMRGNGLLS
jgi:hypothetical protein